MNTQQISLAQTFSTPTGASPTTANHPLSRHTALTILQAVASYPSCEQPLAWEKIKPGDLGLIHGVKTDVLDLPWKIQIPSQSLMLPGAELWLPTQPAMVMVQKPTWRMTGDRIRTPRFTNSDALRSLPDIREILSDNAIRDILEEEEEAEPDRIRGTASNQVIRDWGVDELDPETMQEVMRGFMQPDARFFGVSVVSTPNSDETNFVQQRMNEPWREPEESVNNFVRARAREDGFFRRIMPPLRITNDELDRQIPTEPGSFQFSDPHNLPRRQPVLVQSDEMQMLEFFAFETMGVAVMSEGVEEILSVDFS